SEVILTVGYSYTVSEFLKSARKRKFTVIVTENAPSFSGHNMAKTLSEAGISTTLITDASAYAVMARVNKVIVGTHAGNFASSHVDVVVMANGGLLAPCGVNMVALAARAHSVPFVVVTGLYKLTPLYPVDEDTFNNRNNPAEILPFEFGSNLKNVHVLNPAYDYVPPENISLFITNVYVFFFFVERLIVLF